MADPVAILKQIAKQSGKTVRTLNLFDPKVCKSPTDPDRPWMHLPLPGDFFRHQVSIEYKRRKVQLHANADFMLGRVSGSFAINAFSINRRDLDKSEMPLRISSFPALPVFAHKPSDQLGALLNSAPLQQAQGDLQLKGKESLHLYSNAIEFYLQRSSVQEIMSAIEVMCSLAERLPAGQRLW